MRINRNSTPQLLDRATPARPSSADELAHATLQPLSAFCRDFTIIPPIQSCSPSKAKVIATLGKETNGAVALVNLASPAIELDLMKPAEAFTRPVSPEWNAGLEKANAEQVAALKLSSLNSTKLPAGWQAKPLLRRS